MRNAWLTQSYANEWNEGNPQCWIFFFPGPAKHISSITNLQSRRFFASYRREFVVEWIRRHYSLTFSSFPGPHGRLNPRWRSLAKIRLHCRQQYHKSNHGLVPSVSRLSLEIYKVLLNCLALLNGHDMDWIYRTFWSLLIWTMIWTPWPAVGHLESTYVFPPHYAGEFWKRDNQ